ncbi:hypothetical protein [Haloarchaeobius sp. TZWSO28]|uniref:hypothetical protein n=1 Tax=Haloarchaeobius sp. TZWSO28 TaxID=3446119 RepID=UPI003EB7E180
MSVEVTIIDSQPCAVYQDVVYDREVTLEFNDGTKIGAFDPRATVLESLIGNTLLVELSLVVSPENAALTDEQTSRVESNPEEPLGWRYHDFYGRVVERQSPSGVSLDVGVGTVGLSLDSEAWQGLDDGSFLHVRPSRVDVSVETE